MDTLNNVPLREYLESKIESIEKATTLAKDSMEARLAGMNEFRSTLKDQASRFATRVELEAKIESLENEIRSLQKLVWIGVGASLTIQFLLKFFVK